MIPAIALIGIGAAIYGLTKLNTSEGDLLDAVQSINVTPDTPDQSSDTINVIVDEYGDILSPVHENFGSILGEDMDMSENGLNVLKRLETFSPKSYPDHKGRSIGYGHLIRAGDGLSASSIISLEQGTALLSQDVSTAEAQVNRSIDVELTQSQFDALVSFCYNVGVGAFASSTLVKKINSGDISAANEFDRWVHASGVVNDVLVARREIEKSLFLA